MVEVKPLDVLTDRNLVQWFVQDEMYKGLVVAPKLRYVETEARRYDFFTREKSAEEAFSEGIIEEPMPSAAGSDLTLIRTTDVEVDSARMRMFGYRYVVDDDMKKESPEAFLADLQDLSYGLAIHLETATVAAIKSAATDAGMNLNDGQWNDSAEIGKDLSDMTTTYARMDVKGANLDQLFYNATTLDYLRHYIIDQFGLPYLDEQGNDISFKNMMHYYVSRGLEDGETFGWNSQLPPGAIVYRKLKGSYADMKAGTEAYRPIVNMKMIPHDGLKPRTEYQFGIEYAIPIPRPNYIFYEDGL